MKMLITVILAFLAIAIGTISFASVSEKAKSTGETIKGNIQETVGKATDNKEMEAEGKKNKLKGTARGAKEKIKDTASEAADIAKEKAKKAKEATKEAGSSISN